MIEQTKLNVPRGTTRIRNSVTGKVTYLPGYSPNEKDYNEPDHHSNAYYDAFHWWCEYGADSHMDRKICRGW